jgi:hypothetical protein
MDFSTPIDIAPYQTIDPITQQSIECSLRNAASQISNFGLLFLFLLIGCHWFGRWNRKHSKQQAAARRRQQIESLERIWRMTAKQEP